MRSFVGLIINLLLSCVVLGNGKRPLLFLEPNCGSTTYKYSPRIAYGDTASILEHPWMAFISSRIKCDPSKVNDPEIYCTLMCGGSLITERFVLSAAHCTFNQYTTIKLGEFNIEQSTANGIELPAVQQIAHPDYDAINFKNDIAIYKLARTVTYTSYIRPVCLPINFNPLPETSFLTVTGWGRNEHGYTSDVLRKGIVRQRDRSYCFVDRSQICSGRSISTACKGDSGGPVTGFHLTKGKYIVVQLGIVSYGGLECPSDGVYTNVMYYINWIKKVVQDGRTPTRPAQTRKPNNYPRRQTTRAPVRWTKPPTISFPPLPPPFNDFNWF